MPNPTISELPTNPDTETDTTDTLENMPTEDPRPLLSSPPSNQMVRLSAWLEGVPSDELCMVLKDYEEAVKTILESLPLPGDTFTIPVLQPGKNAKPQNQAIGEEALRDTAEARVWLIKKRTESRRQIMRETGQVGLSFDQVTADPATFDDLLKQRRAYLEAQKKGSGNSRQGTGKTKTSDRPPGRASSAPVKNTKASGHKKAES